ncbi:MAG: extracellular solute-binding protein [Oscillospiraceae bacterium]|jgi:putative aldouronate transport system substrate-binding protein|nr:extracellular solute-binding protein [Oscillospiraceae bacterium]
MKKTITMALTCAMLLTMAGCNGNNGGSSTPQSSASQSSTPSSQGSSSTPESEADDPILTGEKPELKILSMHQSYNYEEQIGYTIMEELTGYKTHWYMLPADNADQKLLLEISSGEDYDLLLRISPSQYAQLSKQNALIDLTGILDAYGANIQNAVSDLAWQSVTNDAGVINAIPQEDMVAAKDNIYGMLTGGIGVRSDILEDMKAELPTNLDDFTAFLQAAKDRYGIAPMTASKSSFIASIMTAFGMGDAEWYDIDGVYTHRVKHPQLPEYLAYMQKLYSEGLMDNDMPINTGDNAKEKFASKNAVAAPLAFWDIPAMVNALATSNPDCKVKFITDMAPNANSKPHHYVAKGAKFISCVSQYSKNPEHAIHWLDILSEPDNFRRTYIGEEGISYEVIDGGYWPIFEGDDTKNFNAYTNSDKLSGICESGLAFQMWQARARKTPEMAEAYEQMNARVDEYETRFTIEAYGKTAPQVQEYITALNQAFSDSMLKAIAEGTDPEAAVAAMQADWDANGGPEVEAWMQQFWDANKALAE